MSGSKHSPPLDNEHIAARLEEVAELLEGQVANPFRVRAYRSAARTLRALERPAHELIDEEGLEGLQELPGIGESLARAIEQLARTDRLGLLERLRGGGAAEEAFRTVPGIGRGLARRIHDELGIETLMELEVAAHDGRLDRVPGIGQRRLQGVRESLAGRFRRRQPAPDRRFPRPAFEPPVAELLDVDREYRERGGKGKLPRISPRRFNPTREAWLPVLHTHRGERHYTALFSNTARAHELGRDPRLGRGLSRRPRRRGAVDRRHGPLRTAHGPPHRARARKGVRGALPRRDRRRASAPGVRAGLTRP